MGIAVQLYTLRKELEKDFHNTIKQVAEMGYEGVEFAGFYNISAKDMLDILARLNLKVVGSHTDLNLLENNFDDVIEYNKTIGNKNIVIPWAKVDNIDDMKELVNRLKPILEKIKDHNMTLHYHNHSHELQAYQEGYLLDYLLTELPDLYAEIDTHWVKRANVDPISYLKKYKNRTKIVHLKDLSFFDGKPEFAPLGEGTMDLAGIIKQAQENDCEWLVVENDEPKQGGIKDIEISFTYLKKNLTR